MGKRRIIVTALGAVSALAATFGGASPAQASPPSSAGSKPAVTVVVSGLDNPRGLGAQGERIYIAESGHGDPHMCFPDPTDPTNSICAGLTGAVVSVADEAQPGARVRNVLTGLASTASPDGSFAGGPSAVSVRGHHVYTQFGGNTVTLPPTVPPNFQSLLAKFKAQFGHLIVSRKGSNAWRSIASVGDLDYAWSNLHKDLVPGQFPDSNPNAVLAAGRERQYVIDAGANTLDVIDDGKVAGRTFFGVPAGSMTDSVPTCLDRGPDGALYVGELLGGSFAPGHARVWRVVPGHAPKVWASGLTAVNGCGFGPDGAFYVVEFQRNGLSEGPGGDPSGDVVRIARNGKQTHLAVGSLNWPSGFAAGEHGIYVSNCSIAPATGFGPCTTGGQLVRISVKAH